MKPLRLLSAALALAVFFVTPLGWADATSPKVAVLGFTRVGTSGPSATAASLDAAREAARTAVIQTGHTLPTDAEMLTAQAATRDGVADTSSEYRAAGRASGASWTVAGRLEEHGATYRLELEVCQVDSGRVESLAREIDPGEAAGQVREMLALLLRPEGIANAPIPWERAVVTAKPSPPAPPVTTVIPSPPPGPPAPPAVRHAYAEGHPIGLGLGMGVLGTLVRPSNAQGPSTAALLDGVGAFAIESVPGLEARLTAAVAVAGPKSFSIDGGARYAFPVVPTARVYAGPELAIGAFVPLGGAQTAHFLARGAAFASLGIGERVQVEVSGDLSVAPGGAGTLLFAGATLRGLFRF